MRLELLSISLSYSGTHGYMAPEVIRKGVQYTSSADWFSLGCVLYKLLKGWEGVSHSVHVHVGVVLYMCIV